MRTKRKESRESELPVGRLRLALAEFVSRAARRTQPEGEWVEGLWQPSPRERQPCCQAIRPSTANRQALESHCRSQAHVAALFGVDVADLKAAVRRQRNEEVEAADAPGQSPVDPTMQQVSRSVRRVNRSQLRTAIRLAAPAIERLRALGEEEDLLQPLVEAMWRVQRLVLALETAKALEECVLGLTPPWRSPAGPVSPALAVPDAAGLDEEAGEEIPRRLFEAAPAAFAA